MPIFTIGGDRKTISPLVGAFLQACFLGAKRIRLLNSSDERNEAMARAYLTGVYTMAEIGEHFGVHYMTVSRAVRVFEDGNGSM